MTEKLGALADHRLERKTVISLRHEPACFSHLCSRASLPPLPIDSLHADFASADWAAGRGSVWATLEMRSSLYDGNCSLLGFDETFLRPFSRALIETAATRQSHRMTIARIRNRRHADATQEEPPEALSPLLARGGFALRGCAHVVDYVRGPGLPLHDLLLAPCEDHILVGTTSDFGPQGGTDTLFQLPRTDSFLRAFVATAMETGRALEQTLAGMQAIERHRHAAIQPAAPSSSDGPFGIEIS